MSNIHVEDSSTQKGNILFLIRVVGNEFRHGFVDYNYFSLNHQFIMCSTHNNYQGFLQVMVTITENKRKWYTIIVCVSEVELSGSY